MTESRGRVLLHEYFYRRLCDLDEDQRSLIQAMRTKGGLIILCDRLRTLELEKLTLIRVYEDLKQVY